MQELPASISVILSAYDVRTDAFIEAEVQRDIQEALKALPEEASKIKSVVAENIVFLLAEGFAGTTNGWGTYFGPMFVFPDDAGKMIENPGLTLIDEDVIIYWQERAKLVKHPILRARYADAAWDLSYKATNKNAHINNAQTAIDAYCEVVRMKYYGHPNEAVNILTRALNLALLINDKNRIEIVRDEILNLQKDVGGGEGDEFWSFSYDLLVDKQNVPLTEEQKNWIIGSLETALEDDGQAVANGGGIRLSIERTAFRLAEYYRRHRRLEDVNRVMEKCATAYIAMSTIAEPMLGVAWLSKIHDVLSDFGCKETVEKVAVQLRVLGSRSRESLSEQTFTTEIKKEELDAEVNRILQGTAERSVAAIGSYFIPNYQETIELVKRISKASPLSSFLPISIVDSEGREVSKVGPVEEDLDGRIIYHTGQNIQLIAGILRYVLEEWIKRFSLDSIKIAELLFLSPLFEESRRSAIERGIRSWLERDHVVSVHLLIPQIEHLLRRLLVGIGQSGYKTTRRNGGIQMKLLDDILRDESVTKVLGESCVKYLLVLLTDSRGLNIRNNLCHGLIEPASIGSFAADRMIHVLLILGSLRETKSGS